MTHAATLSQNYATNINFTFMNSPLLLAVFLVIAVLVQNRKELVVTNYNVIKINPTETPTYMLLLSPEPVAVCPSKYA